MNFKTLLKITAGEPVFSSSILLTGDVPVSSIRKQLSRWVSKGMLMQLKRGVYAVSIPYAEKEPHPFLIANMIKKASYISMQSALQFYGLIPEYVPVVTSVTTGRPRIIDSKAGRYQYRHLKRNLFWGYQDIEIVKGTGVFIALPEKALLDLIYLVPGADSVEYIEELRLQNTDKINLNILNEFAEKFGTPKLKRAAENIKRIIKN